MYAIVDIETTGGYAAANDITEIAIILHDGEKVTDRFQTLVKPSVPIPYFIQSLTGILPEMVRDAPAFAELAPRIADLLNDRVFVAHNVNFDFSFLKYHLEEQGYTLGPQRLCTVRLARKVFPGLPSYSLGNLCRQLGIPLQNRHRAGGDAEATALLFGRMLTEGGLEHIRAFLRGRSRERYLPPHLPPEQIDDLPYAPGVYYFHDQKDRIVYVGKARNIRYRVTSHFTHNGAGRQRQEFLRTIHRISCKPCGSELMAFIFENIEIRRHWPRYNVSQKSFSAVYGLYVYEDANGYHRLHISNKKPALPAYYTFSLLAEGHRLLNSLIREFGLCPVLCFVQSDRHPCVGLEAGTCTGACRREEAPDSYNRRVAAALKSLQERLPSFAILEQSYDGSAQACVLMEAGRFVGMGYIPSGYRPHTVAELRRYIEPYPENDYIRGLIFQYVQRFPHKKIELNDRPPFPQANETQQPAWESPSHFLSSS